MDVKGYVVDFIKTLSDEDKRRMRVMLSHGIICGTSYANEKGIEPKLFNKELKSILEETR